MSKKKPESLTERQHFLLYEYKSNLTDLTHTSFRSISSWIDTILRTNHHAIPSFAFRHTHVVVVLITTVMFCSIFNTSFTIQIYR